MTKSVAGHSNGEAEGRTEQVVARLRSHGRALFWPTLLLFAVCGATGYVYGTLPEPWQNAAVLIGAGLIVLLLWFLPLMVWLTRRYTITTRRVIVRTGFFMRVRQEILHSRGYGVSVRTNWIQAMIGTGDVRITAGQGNPIVLKDVPGATLVQQALHDLIEQTAPADSQHALGE
ncbi:PH domain-containing protein [Glaciibacter psychrotolerans]|uniref:Putative membrane protein YdbT with pleckstrin-like domain n=1 Tax=Glaciibacter psychrotolerans TaxID=670054 RepID=A0A7Z0J6T6_9MICO|nr:PH domain-containing protein [Leifsonia psychrotolerans]NYJ20273.1 putative membrane protein YdbT with pleckstrin-like domain [Leifsonia psychrotolerans]